MKRTLKIIGIIIVSIILIYVLFITEESIRLKNKGGREPLIILGGYCWGDKLERTERSYKTDCKGLGYSLKREYVLSDKSSEDLKMYYLIHEEFWLFDKFLLWGWVS